MDAAKPTPTPSAARGHEDSRQRGDGQPGAAALGRGEEKSSRSAASGSFPTDAPHATPDVLRRVLDLLDGPYSTWEPGPEYAPEWLREAHELVERALTGCSDGDDHIHDFRLAASDDEQLVYLCGCREIQIKPRSAIQHRSSLVEFTEREPTLFGWECACGAVSAELWSDPEAAEHSAVNHEIEEAS